MITHADDDEKRAEHQRPGLQARSGRLAVRSLERVVTGELDVAPRRHHDMRHGGLAETGMGFVSEAHDHRVTRRVEASRRLAQRFL
jgi:hypothetical protein